MYQVENDSDLSRIIGFNQNDLLLNRRGQMSERQILAAQQSIASESQLIIILVIALETAIGVWMLSFGDSILNWLLNLIAVQAIVLPPIFYISRLPRNIKVDIEINKVMSLVGSIRLTSYHYRGGHRYTLLIGNQWFAIERPLFETLQSITYREPEIVVYYLPKSKVILSIEPVMSGVDRGHAGTVGT